MLLCFAKFTTVPPVLYYMAYNNTSSSLIETTRIVQNSGGGKLWRIWQIKAISNSPMFHPPNMSFILL